MGGGVNTPSGIGPNGFNPGDSTPIFGDQMLGRGSAFEGVYNALKAGCPGDYTLRVASCNPLTLKPTPLYGVIRALTREVFKPWGFHCSV